MSKITFYQNLETHPEFGNEEEIKCEAILDGGIWQEEPGLVMNDVQVVGLTLTKEDGSEFMPVFPYQEELINKIAMELFLNDLQSGRAHLEELRTSPKMANDI